MAGSHVGLRHLLCHLLLLPGVMSGQTMTGHWHGTETCIDGVDPSLKAYATLILDSKGLFVCLFVCLLVNFLFLSLFCRLIFVHETGILKIFHANKLLISCKNNYSLHPMESSTSEILETA